MSGQTGGTSAVEMKARHAEWAGEQPCLTACALCSWTHTGTAAEGRVEAAEHRANAHPALRATRRRRGSLTRFLSRDDGWKAEGDANAAEIAAMHAKREQGEAA